MHRPSACRRPVPPHHKGGSAYLRGIVADVIPVLPPSLPSTAGRGGPQCGGLGLWKMVRIAEGRESCSPAVQQASAALSERSLAGTNTQMYSGRSDNSHMTSYTRFVS